MDLSSLHQIEKVVKVNNTKMINQICTFTNENKYNLNKNKITNNKTNFMIYNNITNTCGCGK